MSIVTATIVWRNMSQQEAYPATGQNVRGERGCGIDEAWKTGLDATRRLLCMSCSYGVSCSCGYMACATITSSAWI